MAPINDHELLEQFVRDGSDAAFAQLVERHSGLVLAAAARILKDPDLARDVAQEVFVLLARKARDLGRGVIIAGWLYQTACWKAASFRRSWIRRAGRETGAVGSAIVPEQEEQNRWQELNPVLDAALMRLPAKSRDLIVLRFFERRPIREVAEVAGIGERAAQKRIQRAVERLTLEFHRRGVLWTSAAMLAALERAGLAGGAADAGGFSLRSRTSRDTGAIDGSTWTGGLGYKLACGLGVLALGLGLVLTAAFSSSGTGALSSSPQGGSPLGPSAAVVEREPFSAAMRMTLGAVGAVAVQPDGRIVLGSSLHGFFIDEATGITGVYHRGALRLHADGRLDRSFHCPKSGGPSAPMRDSVTLLPDGRIFLTGQFDDLDGASRPGYAVVRADGGVDRSFEPWRGRSQIPGRMHQPGGTFPAALLGDDSVAVVAPAIERAHLSTVHRLRPDGSPYETPIVEGGATNFARPSGLIRTLDHPGFWGLPRRPIDWSNPAPSGVKDLPTMWRLPPVNRPFDRLIDGPTAGDVAFVFRSLFAEVPLEICRYAVRLPDGGTLLPVRDGTAGGAMASGQIIRFDGNWLPAGGFTNRYTTHLASELAIKRLADGGFLVAGIVGTMEDRPFPGLVRLRADGTIDEGFRCQIGDSPQTGLHDRVMGIAVQRDGRILITGYFTRVNGVECPHVARLRPDGSLDESFRVPFLTADQFNRSRRIVVSRLTEASPPATGSRIRANEGKGAVAPASTGPTILITSQHLDGTASIIGYLGTPGQVYVLQACASLLASDWRTVATNATGSDGRGVLRDDSGESRAMRFYRIAIP